MATENKIDPQAKVDTNEEIDPKAKVVIGEEVATPTIRDPSEYGLTTGSSEEVTSSFDSIFTEVISGLRDTSKSVSEKAALISGLSDEIKREAPELLGLSKDVSGEAGYMAGLARDISPYADVVGSDAERIRQLSESYLAGDIPADVQSQIRRMTSERGLAGAIGRGQAGQALTARDLGLTSLQMQQTGVGMRQTAAGLSEAATGILGRAAGVSGMAAEAYGRAGALVSDYGQMLNVAGSLQRASAETLAASANITSLMGKFSEERRNFDRSYELEVGKLLEEARRTDVDVNKLNADIRKFDADQNLNLVNLLSDFELNVARVQTALAQSDIDDTNIMAGFNNVEQRIDAILTEAGSGSLTGNIGFTE